LDGDGTTDTTDETTREGMEVILIEPKPDTVCLNHKN